ncbi:MAG: hypothetical protein Q8O39_00900 [bacterium]|nr:hypothetical protein [bacterium]
MKKESKNIGIDFDGVIIDHTKTKINFAKKFGVKVLPKQTSNEVLKKIVKEKDYQKIKKYIYGKGTSEGQKQKGVERCLKKLINLGHKIFVVSRRNSKQSRKEAIKWLATNFPKIFNPQNIFFVDSDEEKNDICKKLKIEIFLDDKPSVFDHLKSVKQKFLFNPFKICFDFNKTQIQSVCSWADFFKKINTK